MPIDSLKIPFNPPTQYSIIWLVIACGLVLLIILWYAFVMWHTRRRPLKSLENLRVLTDEERLLALKQKYLRFIDENYAKYQNGQITIRGLHRGLSLTVRYFVYEAAHFPAQRLTLTDLSRAPYPKLTKVIAGYYSKEFATIEGGDAENAVAIAKELISQWA